MIYVKDMTCGGCVATIQRNLLMHQIVPKIDLEEHSIEVKANQEEEAVRIITSLGYHPLIK